MGIEKTLSFGFEQTFTISEWWSEPGFVSISDTPLKREKILDLSVELAKILDGRIKESLDIYGHIQYEVYDAQNQIKYWVTLDPGSIEVKTVPLYFNELKETFDILFSAAYASDLYPYRNWWYGVKGGTEGGTHINMGGKTIDTNPFVKNPELLLKYIVWIHNHPCMHYPFMGPDVGPEGNAMRMDEQVDQDGKASLTSLKKLIKLYDNNKKIALENFEKILSETSLYKEKCSMPSLFKFKAPLYLIEDRAQEAFRSSEDVLLMTKLRLVLFNYLLKTDEIKLEIFDKSLHESKLTNIELWSEFGKMCKKIKLDPKPYKIFFDRQFPVLISGAHPSDYIELRLGRKPRVVTDKKYKNGICISKTIDTRHKRLEFYQVGKAYEIIITLPNKKIIDFSKKKHSYIDVVETDNNKITITVKNSKKETIENTIFDFKNMMWD